MHYYVWRRHYSIPDHESKSSAFQPSQKLNSKVSLWQGDITKLAIDCIVNSVHGNENLNVSYYSWLINCKAPPTVADCIYKAGGRPLLLELCQKMEQDIFLTEPVVTKGYDLPAKCEFYVLMDAENLIIKIQ